MPLHLHTLFMRLMLEQAEARLRWAAWAREQIESWPNIDTGDADAVREILRTTLLAAEREAAHCATGTGAALTRSGVIAEHWRRRE